MAAAVVGLTVAGVAVAITFDGTPVRARDLQAMARAAPHRGGNGGTWVGRGAALAQLGRDAVGDRPVRPLSRHGVVLVADARLDNRRELAEDLAPHGLVSADDEVPDAELLLAAYRQWGLRCPELLIGDFAFVVWDMRYRRLLAARDPMGMRSLHLHVRPGRHALAATEIKQLLAHPAVPRRIDERGLVATLAGPFLPAGGTVYDEIESLPAGHATVIDPGSRRTWSTWRPDAGAHFVGDDEAARLAYRSVLRRAVKDRLGSTGDVGVLLSGGMDSGSMASVAGDLLEPAAATGRVHTYSFAFDELPDSDERVVSDHIVRRYGFRGTAFPADDAYPLAGYPDHAPDEDDPYSWVYQALLERVYVRAAGDGVSVLMGGDRGDETTGDWVFDELGLACAGHPVQAWSDVRAVHHQAGWRGVRRQVLMPYAGAVAPRLVDRRARSRRPRPWPAWVPDAVARRTDLGDLIHDAKRVQRYGGAARSLRHHRILLPHAARIAALHERTRARAGLASVDPFADRRLVELVLSMPQWRVQRRSAPKALARSAMRGLMPEEARVAAHKNIPHGLFDRGFRDRARPVVECLLTDTVAGALGWLDEGAARTTYEGYVASGDASSDFWWPLTVEMWLRRWWT